MFIVESKLGRLPSLNKYSKGVGKIDKNKDANKQQKYQVIVVLRS